MKRLFTSSLSAIAALAITMYLLGNYNSNLSWYTLLMCLIIGIATFLIPLLVEKVNFTYSIISTGITILLMIPF